ncbi:hypothetical protein BGZ93_007532 [Podila epicladia]|nr:hypothetical protein BGZ92_002820 [Podila epicladia]KAG0094110.1 hypothetical protein BGZ93_007532 [Podila epicladia]
MTFLRGYRSSTAATFRYPSSAAIGATLTQADLNQPIHLELKDQQKGNMPFDQPRSDGRWKKRKQLPWEDESSEEHTELVQSNSYLGPWRLKYQEWARDLTSLDILEPPRPPMPRQESFLGEIRVPGSGSLMARAVIKDTKARQDGVEQ